jgi:mannan endo-1,4-beta-mannosidase
MKEIFRHGVMEMKFMFKLRTLKIAVFFFCMASAAQVFALDPANPNANDSAKKILNYFATLTLRTDHRLVSGQFIGWSGGANYGMITDIYNSTGKWIGIVGSDYCDWTNGQVVKYNLTNPPLIKAWKAGSLVALQVHMTNPANPLGGGLNDTGVDLNDLLVSGTDTYTRWFNELDTIAKGLSQLQDSGVVVMFRPFHEMNGGWFWWGAKDQTKFKAVWKQVFDYFTTTKHLNNLLWVYGPNMGSNTASYYPGDEYVDITGLDAYTSNITTAGISGYSSVVNLGKPFGFTEFGPENASNPSGTFDYRIFINGVKTYFPKACFFMTWNDKWSLATNTHVQDALYNSYVANRSDLNFDDLPSSVTTVNSFSDIKAYPNPLDKGGSLKLQLKGMTEGDELKVNVFDPSGKQISQQTLKYASDGMYELKSAKTLQQGNYLLLVETRTKSETIQFAVK